jgi:glutamine synthetase
LRRHADPRPIRSDKRQAHGTKEGPNLGHKPRQKEGYFPVPPVDSMQDLRTEMVLTMESVGIPIEAHHHEVATAGQAEIDMRFTTRSSNVGSGSSTAAAKRAA